MNSPKSILEYPQRGYGMDHDRYEWSLLSDRPKVRWPNQAKLAVWVNVCLQFFPIDQKGHPFKVPGGMSMPYPDLRHYTLRDYGNRVGIFRFLEAFERFGMTPSYAVNTRLAERNPYLIDLIKEQGNEILCHGLHMDALHYGGQAIDEERALIKRSLDSLRDLTGQDIKGWLSPARSESDNTANLLVENGIEYFCDWVNDDMPYPHKTANGTLMAMPLSNELDDSFILMQNLHSEVSYVEQVCDACNFLLTEAEQEGGRILALNVHPWMLGQPHRIGKLEQVLDYISSQDDVWNASPGQILSAFADQ